MMSLIAPAQAEIVRNDTSSLCQASAAPTSLWQSSTEKPKAVVLAIHGMVMHGLTFDALARRLAEQGFIVVAPDIRGYGRWLRQCNGGEPNRTINYRQSQEDLLAIMENLKSNYPRLPLFLVGESLGADMSVRLSVARPDLVDGLVLSSPAIKRRTYLWSKTFADIGRFFVNPGSQLDITPYIKKFASEDPRITQGMIDDPLIRKHLSTMDLLKSQIYMRSTLKFVKFVPESASILIIQGDKDRLLKSNAVVLLLKRLRSKDQTVRWFHEKGHVLLETAYLHTDTLQTVEGWLLEHARKTQILQAKEPSVFAVVETH